MYAVVIEYWNGTTYSMDYDGIVVYANKADADAEAAAAKAIYKADAMVNVVEVEVR
jgi:hypothetical protein